MQRKIVSSVVALCIMLSCIIPALAAPPVFTDVPSGHPHKAAIDYCTENQFFVGKGSGLFDPDGLITRAEFITVWAKTFHARRHNFNDATKTKNDTDNAIVLMQGLGYISGISLTEFSHKTPITRQEVAQIVYNTYLKGNSSADEYQNYSDHKNVSGWAKHAVSVCYKKGIFTNIAGATFEPRKPMTRAEVCAVLMKLLKTEVSPHLYTVTVTATPGGLVVPDKTKAAEGETVTLTVTPDPGYALVTGSLKYNGVPVVGNSFTMPADNVVITAEFEVEMFSITVAPMTDGDVVPNKTQAAAGETVTLTVNPDSGFELVAGSLKYNGSVVEGGSFTMPADNVTITAQFQAE